MLPEDILALIRRERLSAEVIYLGTSRYALSQTARIRSCSARRRWQDPVSARRE